MKKYVLLAGFVFCWGCQENADQEEIPVGQDSVELSQPFSAEVNRTVTLLPEAREAVSEWLAYATAQNEMESLRNTTGKEIIQDSRPILQIMENLNSTIPDSMQTRAVQARTNVLYTKAGILQQLANKKNKNTEEIYRAASDLITEFDNFKIQLNELYLKAPEDFEMELDRQFEESRTQDSINRLNSEEIN